MIEDLKRYAGVVEYKGSNYCGWQIQPNGVSVQEKIEQALFSLFGTHVRIAGSGRTDAGVHARGQVFSFDAPNRYPPCSVRNALNANLPVDIAVLEIIEVAADFHARYTAKRKEYSYAIYSADVRPVLTNDFVWFYPHQLTLDTMAEVASAFVGRRDYRAFTTEAGRMENCVRTIEYATVTKIQEVFAIRVCADGFLYNLVRAIAGCVAEAGRGKFDAKRVQYFLSSGERELLPPLAPAKGLTLEWVEYADYPQLKRASRYDG